jgi:hypothetical protein
MIAGSRDMDLSLDLSETGLAMFFKPYQIASLDILWNSKEPLLSRQVWEQVNEILPGIETTGKGGYRRIYSSKFSKPEASTYLTEKVTERLQTL